MCEPTSIAVATTAIAAGSAYMGFRGKKQQAQEERRAANLNFAQDSNALGAQAVETDASNSEAQLELTLKALQQQGQISASASDMGLAGATVQNVLTGANNEIARESAITDLDHTNQRRQIDRDLLAARQGRDSKVRAARNPSKMSLVLGLSKAALQGANAYTSAGGKF